LQVAPSLQERRRRPHRKFVSLNRAWIWSISYPSQERANWTAY
jgi:hypothetical protein